MITIVHAETQSESQAKLPLPAEPAIQMRYLALVPNADVSRIERAPMPDYYQLAHNNTMHYLHKDGHFMFKGSLYETKQATNLSERRLGQARAETLKTLDDSSIVYTPKGRQVASIYVFTDIECGYCRRFHTHMQEINKRGVEVRYVLTPLRGPQSTQKAIAVQCASDQQEAMDVAKRGGVVRLIEMCDNKINENVDIALYQLGLRGTPMVMLKNGKNIGGYMEPDDLLDAIQKNS